jgi:3-phenylpropionate/cinnamic acid dioxygenase small subunit
MEAPDEHRAGDRGGALIDEAFYDSLVHEFADWREESAADPAAASLLVREARCLDEGRFDDWLALFAAECVYWVPGTAGGGDPRREVAVSFDDRRRLEDRIFRLRTGSAWSQTPASRTVHLVSNVCAFPGRRLRANFIMSEFRAGSGRAGMATACRRRAGSRSSRSTSSTATSTCATRASFSS